MVCSRLRQATTPLAAARHENDDQLMTNERRVRGFSYRPSATGSDRADLIPRQASAVSERSARTSSG